jgi:TPR repeat protein
MKGIPVSRRTILLATLLYCTLTQPLQAGVDEGVSAYQRGDYAAAYREFLPLAEQGDPDLQHKLGMMLSSGKGVGKDYPAAVQWYRLAAEQGHARAQYSLGNMYFLGYGVTPDLGEALKWFSRAVAQGESHSRHRLGQMYEKGVGVEKDYVKAYMWFSLAVDGGVRKSIRSRNFLADLMTPEEIDDARRLASEWRPGAPETASKL